MADGEDDLVEGLGDKNGKNPISSAKNKASQMKQSMKQAKDVLKKVSKKFNKASAKIGKVVAKIAAKLGPALPYVAIALLILFVIIGICGFLATMPGMLTGKLKQFADAVGTWWQSLGSTQADASVKEDDVIDTTEYIRSMGYDLIGYGFIPAKNIAASISDVKINDEGKYINADGSPYNGTPGQYYDKYGILYSTGGDNSGANGTFETAGAVVGFYDYPKTPDTSLIRTYLLSNNRMFSIRNYDNQDSPLSWIQGVFGDTNENWSRGLISLYHATDLKATGPYSEIEFGYIKANPISKTLNVKVGWNTNEMQFGMDGWSGRYGLSLEFLLSLHLGTMAPELVTTMARSFDTEVQVYLGDLQTDVTGWFKEDEPQNGVQGPFFTGQDMYNADEGVKDWISARDARNIMKKFGLVSRKQGDFPCSYAAPKTIYAQTPKNPDITSWDAYVERISGGNTTEYNKLVTQSSSGNIDDTIRRKEDYINLPGVDTWKMLFNIRSYPQYLSYFNGGDGSLDGTDIQDDIRKKMKIVIQATQKMFQIIGNTTSDGNHNNAYNGYYHDWINEEDETKTVVDWGMYWLQITGTEAGAGEYGSNWNVNWNYVADRLDGTVNSRLEG